MRSACFWLSIGTSYKFLWKKSLFHFCNYKAGYIIDRLNDKKYLCLVLIL